MSLITRPDGVFTATILIGICVYILVIVARYVWWFHQWKTFFNNLPGYSVEQKHWFKGHLLLVSEQTGKRRQDNCMRISVNYTTMYEFVYTCITIELRIIEISITMYVIQESSTQFVQRITDGVNNTELLIYIDISPSRIFWESYGALVPPSASLKNDNHHHKTKLYVSYILLGLLYIMYIYHIFRI